MSRASFRKRFSCSRGVPLITNAITFFFVFAFLSPCFCTFRFPRQARLPHGIAAIRDHIESVDNVPLLVSLFTDATPATTKDMLKIYQENDECTLAVGMSHRSVSGRAGCAWGIC